MISSIFFDLCIYLLLFQTEAVCLHCLCSPALPCFFLICSCDPAALLKHPASGQNDHSRSQDPTEKPFPNFLSFAISLLLISSPVQKRIFSVSQEKTGFARGFSGLLLFVAILCVHAAVYDGDCINNPASPCTSCI